MKLDVWALLDAGGVFQYERYEIRNSKGQLHRDGGPAAIYPDGTQFWHRDGMYHRDDGPAIIYPDGTQKWYLNGNL